MSKITIEQVEGGFILTYRDGRQQVVKSWRQLYAIMHAHFGPPSYSYDRAADTEQPNE